MSKVLAVIGDPVAHSLSPVFQNWLIAHFQLDAFYTAFHVLPHQLEQAVHGMRALGIHGFNVTVPHKQHVFRYADALSHEVQILQAANTLYLQQDKIFAHVTDPIGFIESLQARAAQFANAQVLLLGAGGSAQSIAYALKQLRVQKLYIYNRTMKNADALAQSTTQYKLPSEVVLPANLQDAIAQTTVIINTTSVGMFPYVDATPLPDFSAISRQHFVYDLIYNPYKTKLLHEAEQRGAAVQNGLDMLIFQGLASLRIWFNAELLLSAQKLSECRELLYKKLGMHG